MLVRNSKHGLKLLLLFLLIVVGVWSETAVPPAAASPNQQSARDPRFGAVESFWAPGEAAELGVGWNDVRAVPLEHGGRLGRWWNGGRRRSGRLRHHD